MKPNPNLNRLVAFAAAFAPSPHVQCFLIGHDWDTQHPSTVRSALGAELRVEQCQRCFSVRKHEPPQRAPFNGIDQAALDGMPGTLVAPARTLSADEHEAVREKSAQLQAEAAEAFRRATGTESTAVS